MIRRSDETNLTDIIVAAYVMTFIAIGWIAGVI